MITQELYHGDDLCYFCGRKTDARSANPGLWPIYLCHLDESGKVKAHCTYCVDQRLEALEALQIERNAALKLLGYAEDETDLLANIKRLKAHYEQELAYLREGEQALMHYCDKLQEQVDPKDAIAIGLKELLNLQISRQQDEKTTKPERNP